MSSALIVLVTNLSYIIFGVTKYTNRISDFENECARNLISEQDKIMAIDNVIAGIEPGKTLALLFCMVIVPLRTDAASATSCTKSTTNLTRISTTAFAAR